MSIRVRLAFWYAGLTSLVVIIIGAAAYVVHSRNAYEDVDSSLVTAAQHFRFELAVDQPANGVEPLEPVGLGDSSVSVRLYDRDGAVLETSPLVPVQPPIDAQQVLREDAGPAYDGALRWLPGGESFGEGAFATDRDAASPGRIRLYVLPVLSADGGGFVQTWTSLATLDQSMRTFRYLMLWLAAGGIIVVWLGSLLVAGQALRPVTAMTRTARAIAVSHGFSRRITESTRRDELAELARTFNEMLASLEDAYRSQQRFVADAAHELRAPLTAIQGNIELLSQRQDMPDPERQEALAFLNDEAQRLSRIVSELLTLARADAGHTIERRPVELDRLLLEVLADLRPLAERHQVEVVHLDPVVVGGDEDRLKQLLVNLLDNSLKYTPSNGAITVRLERLQGEAVLTVRDTGAGISTEDLPHIFERFYRADPTRRRDQASTGLGLAIVKWIVDQHEGDIAVESEIGSGTAVSVRLPLLAPTEAASARDGSFHSPVPGQASH